MPSATRQLDVTDARALIGACGFSASSPAGPTIGVELESFLVPSVRPDTLPAVELPGGSRLTFEPGGQVELSSPPGPDVATACRSLSTDLAVLREAFSPLGVTIVQSGMSPSLPPSLAPRLVESPRYQAMEAYFATSWPAAGRAMMCATASVQVNLGLGCGTEVARRWRAANVLGPVLAAAFACGVDRGARLATWLSLDPSRTKPVPVDDREPARAWAEYALDAKVMLINSPDDPTGRRLHPVVGEVLTARQWVVQGHALGWPTADDLAYHLTTLFPPVRPRGWLELRMIDALPDPWWRVPVAAATVLLDDDEAVAACRPTAERWWQAARHGLADPLLGPAATVCAKRAVAGLDDVGADGVTALLVEQWAATVAKGCEPPWA